MSDKQSASDLWSELSKELNGVLSNNPEDSGSSVESEKEKIIENKKEKVEIPKVATFDSDEIEKKESLTTDNGESSDPTIEELFSLSVDNIPEENKTFLSEKSVEQNLISESASESESEFELKNNEKEEISSMNTGSIELNQEPVNEEITPGANKNVSLESRAEFFVPLLKLEPDIAESEFAEKIDMKDYVASVDIADEEISIEKNESDDDVLKKPFSNLKNASDIEKENEEEEIDTTNKQFNDNRSNANSSTDSDIFKKIDKKTEGNGDFLVSVKTWKVVCRKDSFEISAFDSENNKVCGFLAPRTGGDSFVNFAGMEIKSSSDEITLTTD